MLGTVALLTLAVWGGGVKGDGNIQEQTRSVASFKAVGIGHGMRARVHVGSPASVKLKGDANLLALIELTVKDGTLQPRVKDDQSLSPSRPIELDITAPAVEGVFASGGAEVTATATPAPKFELGASGGSIVKVSGLQSDSVSLNASGGAELTLRGDARRFTVASSGGSKLHARGLLCEDATVQGTGGTEIQLHATQRLTGALSGGAVVEVEGNPASRSVATSGGAEVHIKG